MGFKAGFINDQRVRTLKIKKTVFKNVNVLDRNHKLIGLNEEEFN